MVNDHQHAKNACWSTISGYIYTLPCSHDQFLHIAFRTIFDQRGLANGDSSYFIGFNVPLAVFHWIDAKIYVGNSGIIKHNKTIYRYLSDVIGVSNVDFPRFPCLSCLVLQLPPACSSPTAEARSSASAVSMAACEPRK